LTHHPTSSFRYLNDIALKLMIYQKTTDAAWKEKNGSDAHTHTHINWLFISSHTRWKWLFIFLVPLWKFWEEKKDCTIFHFFCWTGWFFLTLFSFPRSFHTHPPGLGELLRKEPNSLSCVALLNVKLIAPAPAAPCQRCRRKKKEDVVAPGVLPTGHGLLATNFRFHFHFFFFFCQLYTGCRFQLIITW
jgi:hypothetical protein